MMFHLPAAPLYTSRYRSSADLSWTRAAAGVGEPERAQRLETVTGTDGSWGIDANISYTSPKGVRGGCHVRDKLVSPCLRRCFGPPAVDTEMLLKGRKGAKREAARDPFARARET